MSTGRRWMYNSLDDYSELLLPDLLRGFNDTRWHQSIRFIPWIKLNQKFTGENGRITALYPENKALEKGIYKVTFKTDAWFNQQKQQSFFSRSSCDF